VVEAPPPQPPSLIVLCVVTRVFTKAMPAGKDEASASNPAQRTTFRPPWVKEGPSPLPVPTAPWTLKNARRDSNKESSSENPLAGVQLRKTSVTAKDPQENGKDNTFKRPQLRPVPPKEETKPPKETLPPVKLNSVAERQKNEAMKKPPIQRLPSKDEEIDRVSPSVDAKSNRLLREGSIFDLFVRSKGDSGDEERFGQGGEHAEALADAGAATHAAPSAQDARKRQDETPHTETARTNRTTQKSP
jgi:hypothetical protein